MNSLNDWLLLVLTLPTDNATARMRFWRALKAKGCAVLRDGVYLLPATDAAEAELLELGTSIGDVGGAAHVVRTSSRGAYQEAEFRCLFDRTDEYAAFARLLADARKTLSDLSPAEITRLLRRVGKDFEAISGDRLFSERGIYAGRGGLAGLRCVGEHRPVAGRTSSGRRCDCRPVRRETIRAGHGQPVDACGLTAWPARGSSGALSIRGHAFSGLRRRASARTMRSDLTSTALHLRTWATA